ncbi:conserved domain protein [Bacteroides fluxus YIT 12057]|uniref:Conserved domain protein n=1 Tax=Bacteroides fluxus YIT 12057 TaxID=763034 RepID=F3PW30_9BACE|nr:conserved domain protein [Bacteroides fluxus YIT 12057]
MFYRNLLAMVIGMRDGNCLQPSKAEKQKEDAFHDFLHIFDLLGKYTLLDILRQQAPPQNCTYGPTDNVNRQIKTLIRQKQSSANIHLINFAA